MTRSEILVFAFLLAAGLSHADAATFRIGTAEKAGKGTARDFGPVQAYLNTRAVAGATWEVRNYATPESLYDDFKGGKVDVALLGPVLYVKAHHEIGARAIAADGMPYSSIVFVKADSPLKKVDDLRGRSFAFGYPESTSSHLFPLLMLSKARIKEADLGKHEFVGGHQNVIDAVLAGRFEAGGVIDAAFESNKSKGLRAIGVSDPIPAVPLVVRKDADAAWTEPLRKALLEYKAPSGEGNIPFARGVQPASDADYNQVRFLCKIVFDQVYR